MDVKKYSRRARLHLVCAVFFGMFAIVTVFASFFDSRVVSFMLPPVREHALFLAFVWLLQVYLQLAEYLKNRCQIAIVEGWKANTRRYISVLFHLCILFTVLGVAYITLVFIFAQSGLAYFGALLTPILIGMLWLTYIKYRSDIMSPTINQEESIEINT